MQTSGGRAFQAEEWPVKQKHHGAFVQIRKGVASPSHMNWSEEKILISILKDTEKKINKFNTPSWHGKKIK